MRVATINIASGRDVAGRLLPPGELAAAIAGLDADVVALQEVDAGQARSGGVDQAAVVAGDADWRHAATVRGIADRTPAAPGLRGPGDALDGPAYGIALLARRPVRRWHLLGLPTGRVRRSGEPRVAVAAELDGLTVVGTHLSFVPHVAVRQLRALTAWSARLPGPVLLAGDLNLPGPVPALLTGGVRLVRGRTFPASRPCAQLDHVLALDTWTAGDGEIRRLAVGDHRAVLVTPGVRRRPGPRCGGGSWSGTPGTRA